VQLIDATAWFKPLRKNLGKKNCELADHDIQRIVDTFLAFKETEQSKIFLNQAFGYWKVIVERPLRLAIHSDVDHLAALAEAVVEAGETGLESVVEAVNEVMGEGPHQDANQWLELAERVAKGQGLRWTAKKAKLLLAHLGERNENAAPVIAKLFKPGKQVADPLRGFFPMELEEGERVVQFECDAELRDTEQVPLLEEGGIDAFLAREVLPYAPNTWYDPGSVKTGYEVSFTRYFYKPKPLRTLEEIRADILALEKETEGLLGEIIGEASR